MVQVEKLNLQATPIKVVIPTGTDSTVEDITEDDLGKESTHYFKGEDEGVDPIFADADEDPYA